MAEEDFAARLEGLSVPAYVTITMDADQQVCVSTNLETTGDVRRVLAMASYHFADDLDWVLNDPPPEG